MIKRGFLTIIVVLVFLFFSSSISLRAQVSSSSQGVQPLSKEIRAVPQGWTVFKSQSGLILFHPIGWQVQERSNGGFMTYRPGPGGVATTLVLVEPKAKIDQPAMSLIQRLPQDFPGLFPDLRISKNRLVSQNPEVAIAQLLFSPAGLPYKGVVMCFKRESRGVVYIIAAHDRMWGQEEAVMKQILSSFFYSSGTGTLISSSEIMPQMVDWTDPNEGAFICPVPTGWEIEGGLKRFAPLDTRIEILVTSPDKKILVRFGDATIPPFSLPDESMQWLGRGEGNWYSPDGLHRQLVMRYLPGATFLTQYYLPQRVGPISNVQVKNRPEIAQKIHERKPKIIPHQVDAGEVNFETQTEMGYRKGFGSAITVLTLYPGQLRGGMWRVELLAGYLTVPGAEHIAEGILNKMLAGFRVNPEWGMRQTKLAGKASEIWGRTHGEISEMMHQGYKRRSEISDHAHERWTRAFRGEVLIQDPKTGKKFEVPSGSNYYWRIGSGNEFVGTETNRPDLPLYYLREMKIID